MELAINYYKFVKNQLVIDPKILNQMDLFQLSDLLTLVQLIMTSKRPLRSQLELSVIEWVLDQQQFFTNLQTTSPDSIRELCQLMQYQVFQINEIVFRKGQSGDQFFVIIRGQVGVYLPVEREPLIYEDELINRLNEGQSFGELSLLSEAPRTATIKCFSQCHFAVISKDVFRKVLKHQKQKEIETKVAFLSSLQFLSQLKKRTLETLVYHFNVVDINRGHVLCKEAEKSILVYIIFSGEIIISKKFVMPRGRTCNYNPQKIEIMKQVDVLKNVEIARLSKGEMFGDLDCILHQPYQFQAVCSSTHATLYAITKDVSYQIILQDFLQRIIQHNKSSQMQVFLNEFIKEKIIFRNESNQKIISMLFHQQRLLSGIFKDNSIIKPKQQIIPREKQFVNKYLRQSSVINERTVTHDIQSDQVKIYKKMFSKKSSPAKRFSPDQKNNKNFFQTLEDNYDNQTRTLVQKKLENTKLYNSFSQHNKEISDANIRRQKTYEFKFIKSSIDNLQTLISQADEIQQSSITKNRFQPSQSRQRSLSQIGQQKIRSLEKRNIISLKNSRVKNVHLFTELL